MDEYIKRETALKAIDEYFRTTNPDGDEQIGVLKSRRIIRELPSAYVVPVRHGRWKQTTEPLGWDEIGCVECSECQESFIIGEDFGIDDISYFWHFCPNCGARMEGGSE